MPDASSFEVPWPRDDGLGRQLVFATVSPDGQWQVALYGPNEHCDFLYGHARCADGWVGHFGCAYPVRSDRITVRWDLPNGAWGVYVGDECWALYTDRPALRMSPRRIHSRHRPHQAPFSAEEIRFACAKQRFQRKGTRGGIIEE